MALRSPEVEVIGLTTIFGNGATHLMTTNALRLLEIAGRTDIPVAHGADHPLVGLYERPPTFVHGDDGQGNVNLPPPDSAPLDISAAAFIIQQVTAHPGDITLLTIGPLTNLALALRLQPGIATKVKSVVVMGGNAIASGNATPAAEANIYKDPEAADIVLGAEWPLTMVGLDVTRHVVFTDAHMAQLTASDNPLARHCARITPFYRDFYRKFVDDGFHLHDPTALACVINPDLFQTEEWPIRVEGDGIGRGKTWPLTNPTRIDQSGYEPWRGRPPVTVCVAVDADPIAQMTLQRITQG
jgi:inosine-uridine nucleoside N-ribohydrolase